MGMSARLDRFLSTLIHHVITRIGVRQGDILDETQGGQPVLGAVIGCQQSSFHRW
jgi:hypothetical protein